MAESLTDDLGNTSERDAIIAKWKDKPREELEAAKAESDLFIKTLTTRLDDLGKDYLALREETTAKAQLKEMIDKLSNSNTNDDTTQHTNREDVQAGLKAEDIETLLEAKFTQRELSNKQNENFNLVRSKLKEQFGDNAATVLKQRMDTLGLDQAFTDELAKKHPAVFLKTFGLDEQRSSTNTAPPRSQVRADRFAPATPKRDWNYYQELKKADPRMYLDPKIAVQMHNDAIALGDAFGMPED